MMLRIAITGASGFIGQNLYAYFQSRQNEVIAIDRSKPLLLDGVDVLIHSAWGNSRQPQRFDYSMQKSNVKFARMLADEICRQKIPCVIGLGSQAEYEVSDRFWRDESSVIGLDAYSKAKIEVHGILQDSAERFAWMRLFSVYGRHDRNQWILPNVIKAITSNQSLALGSCDNTWSFLHIDDVISAIEKVIESDLSGSFAVTGVISKGLKHWIQDAVSSLEGDDSLITFSDTGTGRNIGAIPEKLLEIGWKPKVEFKSGVRDYAEWLVGR